MKKSLSAALAKYVSWALEQYRSIKSDYDNEPNIKVVDYELDPKNGVIVVIKVKNSGVFAKFKATELVSDDIALSKLSLIEQKKIQYAAATGKLPNSISDHEETSVKIRSKTLDKKENKHLFTLESTQDGVRFVKNFYTDELIKDKSVIDALDRKDVYEIAFSEGVESILVEKDEIEKAKKAFLEKESNASNDQKS